MARAPFSIMQHDGAMPPLLVGGGWVAEWGTTGDLSEALSSDRIAELSICPVDNTSCKYYASFK